MPTKQPFTPAGVATKISDLYTLTDPQLLEQADAAKADFASWLDDNFSFSDPQKGYLNAIDPDFTAALGYQFYLALKGRLPIELDEPFVINPDDYSSKIVRTTQQVTLTYNSQTGFTLSGGLTVNIGLED